VTNSISKVSYPVSDAALRWLEGILAERFGHRWGLSRCSLGIKLQLDGAIGFIVFDKPQACFGRAQSDLPFTEWDAASEGWHSVLGGSLPAPGVGQLPSPLIEKFESDYVVHYDILGLTYWMLARIEEIGRTDLDAHERFPATSSHAHRHGYLERPVVDEWLHVLGQVIQRQWSRVDLKQHKPATVVSCDVDSPFAHNGSIKWMIRQSAGDVLKRRSVAALASTVVGTLRARRGDHSRDPHLKGLRFIMDVNENAGRSVAFYFIPENTDPKLDNRVSLDDPRMRSLLREIHSRGHEIGVHPGYNTYIYSDTLAKSVSTLRRVLDEEGIVQPLLGGRQHFLRWQTPTTARLWEESGLDYDTTLSYADMPGFRCGTCFEYQVFDPVEDRVLALRQRPFIVMECSVIAQRYLGLGYSDAALNLMKTYQDVCTRVGGQFGLLWHNSHLGTKDDRRFYRELVGQGGGGGLV
jgi:hypothetical protein